MSRVLLFVETGDGRPKSLGVAHRRPRARRGVKLGLATAWLKMTQTLALNAADRWWLVECENAEAGRTLIAYDEQDNQPDPFAPVNGRILASGGKPDGEEG